jgi:hypothetical protein
MKTMRYGIMVLVMGVWVGSVAGRFAQPDYVPAERLIENATAYIAEEPNDPTGYYALARVHYLAFVNKALLVGTFNEREPSSVVPSWWAEDYRQAALRAEAIATALKEYGVLSTADLTDENRAAFYERVGEVQVALEEKGWEPVMPTTERLIEHAGAAQWNFYRAIALDPNNALYTLGQASLGEQYLDFFAETSPALMPAALQTIVLNGVKETYLLAYNLSIREDLELEHLPIHGLGAIISYEAGSAFVRLWEAEDALPADVQEKIADIKASLTTFEELPLGAITPIVFGLEGPSSLSELLAPTQVVSFDLDGDGRIERRPWVQPTTGLLVWDGNGDGRITSGREMFGSVTWWMFFPNGYRAMDVLDDSRDGWLEAGELKGMSVWFDRNSNGVSDAGEVVSVESLGITAIATRATGHDGPSPMCASGLKLQDGRTLPTYDWIAPAAEPAEAPQSDEPEDLDEY